MTMPGELQPLVNNQRIVNADGTPTEYFIRWAQEKQIDISNSITAAQALQIMQEYLTAHLLHAGTGIAITPDGDLNNSPTIALNAGINDLTDVDTVSTPPTSGQALVWDSGASLWKPGSVAGGGGGSPYGPVTIVQTATQRVNSNTTTATFGVAPTAGNFIVLLSFGPGSTSFLLQNTMTYLGGWRNGDGGGYESNPSQSIFAGVRKVQAGDPTTWSVQSGAADNNNLMAFEISGLAYANFRTQRLDFSGSNFEISLPASNYNAGVRYVVVEHDGTADPSFAANAAILNTYTFTTAGNHRAIVIQLDPTFAGRLTGSFTAGPSNPMWGVLDLAGKGSGGGGSAWYFSPPTAASFAKQSGDATQLLLTDDADVGLLVAGNTPVNGDIQRHAYRTLTNKTLDWDMSMRLNWALDPGNFTNIGLLLHDSVGGRTVAWNMEGSGSSDLSRIRWNGLTGGFNSENKVTIRGYWNWIRVARVGANLLYYWSADGKLWHLFLTEGVTSWLANAPDRVGLNVTYNRTNATSEFSVDYFSLTGPAV